MKLVALLLLLVLAAVLLAGVIWLYAPDQPRAALEERYLEMPGDYLDAAGVRLHLRDQGPPTAPAIVMLHGFGASLHTWEPWALALASDHRVISLDLPGFGLTGPDPTGDYTDRRSLEVLVAVIDRLALERVSLIGNSIGGRIAWKLAALHPERVHRLVLISPDGFASPGFEYGKASSVPVMAQLMRYALPTAIVRSSLSPAYGNPNAVTDALVTRYRDLMLAPGVRGAMLARIEQTVPEDPEPLLRRVRAPTLLVWGERDAMIPVGNAADYLRILPDARLASFPELGHVPHEEAPDRSLAPVREFLAR